MVKIRPAFVALGWNELTYECVNVLDLRSEPHPHNSYPNP